MKKRVLSLFLALTLCLTLLPTAVFAEGEGGGSMSGNTTIGGETGGTGGGVLVGENEKTGGGFVVPSEQSGTVSAPVAKVDDTEYDTLQEILDDADEVEITLLGNVTEDITVYAATTIHMGGFSIAGDIDATDSLTLTNGTVTGKVTVTVDATEGTFTMTAPADAAAAIDGGLEVNSGSCSVSGAQIGVKGTLYFGGTSMSISGTEKAVELTAAAGPTSKKLYGSAEATGNTSDEAVFADSTYKVGSEIAKKLSSTQVGGSTPAEPATLTLAPETANATAGATATFTATYTGTGELNAYIQKNGQDENFDVSTPTKNGDGTYTITIKIAKETPAGDYMLYVHEVGDTSVQAKATINVISIVAKDNMGTYYTTIKDAIEKATDGSTITVIAAENRISLPDGIYVENQTGITLDLNGHSLDGCSLNVGGLTTTSQVRTGKLTVVDSSGGNGAVGVTVRDGGKVEFRGSIATSCLQLQVYGGDVKFYGGNIRSFELHNDVAYADFLPKGYCYYNYSGSGSDLGSIVTAADVASVVSAGRYLAVAPCSHGGANGFDINALTCPYCGAPAVAQTALTGVSGNPWRNFADLQTAIDADRDGGSAFRLLADVTGNYTIGGTRITEIDLNGHSIHGTVTVTGGDYEVSFIRTNDTDIVEKVIAHAGAKFATPATPAVIGTLELAEGATWENIVSSPRNPGYKGYTKYPDLTTYKWYAPEDVPDESTVLNNVVIQRLPITSNTLSLKVNGKNVSSVERGTTVQLCAYCNTSGANVAFKVGKLQSNGEYKYIELSGDKVEYKQLQKGGSWYYVAEYTFNEMGDYEIFFTASKDNYSVTSGDKKLTVTKLNLSNAEITFRGSNESTYEPYNATTTAPGFTVTYNGKTLKLGVDYTASGTASSAGVSTQTLTIKAVEGSDYTGSKTAEWRIVPHKAKVEVGDVIKAYDGTTDLPDGKISLVSAAGSAGYQAGLPLPLSEGNGFELTDAKYDSANASETEKNISFTVKLTDTNYTFEDGTTEKAFTLKGSETDKTFKINPATIDPSHNRFEQTVFNDLAKTYEINLKQFLDTILPEGGKYGDIKYGQPSVSMNSAYYTVGGANIGNGKLSLPINKAASSKQGDEIGTVAVQVETTNYQPFTLTIHVIAQDKLVPVLAEGNTVSATDITYGQALADSKLTVNGTMQDYTTGNAVNGTFAWTDDTIKPAANDSYEAEWTFTPAAGYEEYAPATGTVTVKVDKAELQNVSVIQGLPMPLYYTGEPQRAGVIAAGLGVCGERVTFTYSKTENDEYTSEVPEFTEAGTYTVYYKAEAANHEPATGTFSVQIKPLPISLLSIEKISKTYDGTASVMLSTDMLTFFSNAAKRSDIKLPDLTLSFSNARFTMKQADESYVDSPEVGGGKALSFTMTLTSNNYVFEGKSEGTTEVSDVFATDDATRFTITKAAAPTGIQTGTLNVINGTTLDYTFDFNGLLPTLSDPKTYGAVSYTLLPFTFSKGYYFDSTTTGLKDGELLLASLDATGATSTGEIGTITVKVSTGNYEDFTLTLNFYAVDKIAPVVDGGITASDITYGQTLSESSITGKMKNPDTGVEVEGTLEWTAPSTKPNKAGDYEAEWVFTPEAPEYATVTGKVTVKVSTAPIIEASVSEPSYTYDGNSHMPSNITVKLTDGTTLVENTDYTVSAEAKTDAGTYEMKIIGIGNYHGGDSKTYHWRITPRTVNVPTATVEDGVYNGGEAVTPTVTVKDGETVIPASEYEVTYSNNTNAGTATVTVKDVEGGNYVLSETSKTFEITKAAGGSLGTVELTQKYTDTSEHTYTPDWSELPTGQTWSYNSEYSVSTGSTATPTKQDFAADGSLLTYAISGGKAGDTVTITLKASCNNYENFTITLTIALTKKDDQKPLTITGDTSVIYGEKLTLTTTGGSGTGAVTYRIDTANSNGEATIDPETGVLTPVRVGSVSVIAAKAGDKDYNDVTSAPFVLMVKPATPTGAPNYTKITTGGKTLKDAALTTDGSTLEPKAGTLEWVDDEGNVLPDDTKVEANKRYTWRFTPADDNYADLTGEIELYHKSSSGSGSGSSSGSYTITVKNAKNGDVTTDRKSASAGTTVTITVKPDSGYVTDDLTVTDSKGNDLKLTGKGGGKYTFTMPSGKVTVEASFTPAKSENPFTDVPSGAYYEDAVIWAVKNGITGGTSATTFAPNGFCTRAQAVTFLWRAAGSPAPKSTAMAFTDVPAGSYYYDAVLWAVENGVTKGTSDTTFSPNANCSRGQIVTFLWRSQMSPDAAAANPFTDVAADAYYTSAVLWAAERNITGGTSATTFSPSANCTRAQIVTFIYRCMK